MPTPIEHAWREVWAYLRGPAGVNTFAFGTIDAYRDGVQHAGLITEFPEPSDNTSDAFGIQGGGTFTVQIADETDSLDWYWLWSDGSRILLEDGSGSLILES